MNTHYLVDVINMSNNEIDFNDADGNPVAILPLARRAVVTSAVHRNEVLGMFPKIAVIDLPSWFDAKETTESLPSDLLTPVVESQPVQVEATVAAVEEAAPAPAETTAEPVTEETPAPAETPASE